MKEWGFWTEKDRFFMKKTKYFLECFFRELNEWRILGDPMYRENFAKNHLKVWQDRKTNRKFRIRKEETITTYIE